MELIVGLIIAIITIYVMYLKTIADGRKKEVETLQQLLQEEQKENIELRSLLNQAKEFLKSK